MPPALAAALPQILAGLASGAAGAGITALATKDKAKSDKELATINTTAPGAPSFADELATDDQRKRRLSLSGPRRPVIFNQQR